MPLIKAWECPKTGKLFRGDARDKYLAHLKTLARRSLDKRNDAREQARFWVTVEEFQAGVQTFEDIAAWMIANPQVLFSQYRPYDRFDRKGNMKPLTVFQFIKFESMHWDECCSNSHSAPRGKRRNWGGESDKLGVPRGYPGWRGRITFSALHWPFCGEVMGKIGVHTGTGGSGGPKQDGYTVYSHDVTLFAEEFPNMKFWQDLNRPAKRGRD